jgi:hypothetical protein
MGCHAGMQAAFEGVLLGQPKHHSLKGAGAGNGSAKHGSIQRRTRGGCKMASWMYSRA